MLPLGSAPARSGVEMAREPSKLVALLTTQWDTLQDRTNETFRREGRSGNRTAFVFGKDFPRSGMRSHTYIDGFFAYSRGFWH